LDELRREAMAAVAERSHADILSDTPLAPDQVSVTMPRSQLRYAVTSGIGTLIRTNEFKTTVNKFF
jgi:hypothetical protein